MSKAFGIGLLAAGIVLTVLGIHASGSVGSDVSRFFTGTPTDRSIWLLIAGIVAVIVGGLLSSRRTPS